VTKLAADVDPQVPTVEEPLGGGECHCHTVQRILGKGQTSVQSYQIAELARYGRAMVIEGRVQSTEHDEYIYHEALIYPAYALRAPLQRILCLGGANGGMLREFRGLPGLQEVVLVDIDPELHEVSKQHLPHMHDGAFRDPRFRIEFGDPRAIVKQLSTQFDCIFADLPDAVAAGKTRWLFTMEFYRDVKARLKPDGVYVTQAGAAGHLHSEFFASVLRTTRSIFRYAVPYSISVPSYGVPWGFVMASDGIDVSAYDEERVAAALATLDASSLRSYDLVTHRHMFSLPRAVRAALERAGRTSSDSDPIAEGIAYFSG